MFSDPGCWGSCTWGALCWEPGTASFYWCQVFHVKFFSHDLSFHFLICACRLFPNCCIEYRTFVKSSFHSSVSGLELTYVFSCYARLVFVQNSLKLTGPFSYDTSWCWSGMFPFLYCLSLIHGPCSLLLMFVLVPGSRHQKCSYCWLKLRESFYERRIKLNIVKTRSLLEMIKKQWNISQRCEKISQHVHWLCVQIWFVAWVFLSFNTCFHEIFSASTDVFRLPCPRDVVFGDDWYNWSYWYQFKESLLKRIKGVHCFSLDWTRCCVLQFVELITVFEIFRSR